MAMANGLRPWRLLLAKLVEFSKFTMIMISRLKYVEHLGHIILQLLQKSPVMGLYPEHQAEVNKVINLKMSEILLSKYRCIN